MKVLLVDDHPMVRALFSVLVKEEGLDVCGEAASVSDAVNLANESLPSMAIVDISLEGGSGLDLVRRLLNVVPRMAILICSSHKESLYASRAREAGARGYINKKEDADVLRQAVRSVANGEFWFSSDALESEEEIGVSCLSNKELEVFRLVAKGLTSAEIATQLGRSVKTIESHRENIKRRLGLKSGNDLIQFAIRWGLDQV